MDAPTQISDLSADALSRLIRDRSVSCREVMTAYLARIHRFNPTLNAIVNLADDDALLDQADACDAELARGTSRGWLHGVPIAIKDAANAVGFPTTFASRVLANNRAREDQLFVTRLKRAGAIVIGKTNMPEFGLGSNTFNDLFGTTPNPWDPSVSVGGSSGGAAAALATRCLPIADGSDYMGSLRNPAGWNNIFGMRPSQGRVPMWPSEDIWHAQLVTEGPLARTVTDLAQLLATQSGYDVRVPLSIREPLAAFKPSPDALQGLRVGWLGDLGGHLATEPGILKTLEQALARMEEAGAHITPAMFDFDLEQLWQAWLKWRHALVGRVIGEVLKIKDARSQIKAEALWEYEQAQHLSADDLGEASKVRTDFYTHISSMFEQYDVLALPVSQTWPFAKDERWPKQIAGRAMDTYHRWMEVTLYATFAGLPAMSVPAGFHAENNWPMGLQLIGPPQGDAAVLRIASAYELRIPDLLARQPDYSPLA